MPPLLVTHGYATVCRYILSIVVYAWSLSVPSISNQTIAPVFVLFQILDLQFLVIFDRI